jgi:hypothetical protein
MACWKHRCKERKLATFSQLELEKYEDHLTSKQNFGPKAIDKNMIVAC